MADLEEKLKALEAQIKESKAKKAPAAETKALNDQAIALRKEIGQAKKAAKPKEDGEDEEGGAAGGAAKPAAKAEEKKPAAKTPSKAADKPAADKPAADKPAADKPAADKPAAEKPAEKPAAADKPAAEGEAAKKPAAKKGPAEKKDAAKPKDAPKKDEAEAPKAAEAPKDAPKDTEAPKEPAAKKDAPKKATERKKSEKQDAPKEPERKKSEKQATDADVDQVTAGVKAVEIKPKGGGKKDAAAAEPKKESAKPAETKDETVTVHATPSGTGGKVRIVGISGSLRKASWNSGILRWAQKHAPADVEFVTLDISTLPLFNQDNEEKPSAEVTAFKNAVVSADGILIASPEYNYSVPGVLKNAIDVGSRPHGKSAWNNKPVLLASATYSAGGGIRAQMALRQSFIFLNMPVYPGHEVLIGNANEKFDAEGNLIDKSSQDHVTDAVASFHKYILRVKAGVAAVP